MVKLVCPADNPRSEGLECAKTCQNYDLECMSTGCVSGCLCPPGMVSHPLLPGVGSCPFSCRQREEETRVKPGWEPGGSGNGGRGQGGPLAESAAKVRKGDGRKLSGFDPDEI